MPDKPIPEQDPITSKSYAAHYLIATVILIITLFWALWDEAWGQRPWKAFQEQFKTRYSAFLNTARAKSHDSEKDVQKDPEYAGLSAAVKKATEDSAAAAKAARNNLKDANDRLQAVQSVFIGGTRLMSTPSPTNSRLARVLQQRPVSRKKSISTSLRKLRSSFPMAAKRNSTSKNSKRLTTQSATSARNSASTSAMC